MPNPLLWQRTYVEEIPQTPGEIGLDILAACYSDTDANTVDTLQQSIPPPGTWKVGVLGDSVASQWRSPLRSSPFGNGDTQVHWQFATHCGEKFSTVVDTGRAAAVMAAHPDALLFDLGPNVFSNNWVLDESLLDGPNGELAKLGVLMTATDAAPCRVVLNLARQPHPDDTPENNALRLHLIDRVNAELAKYDEGSGLPQARAGLKVADWDARVGPTDANHYLTDGHHLLRPGVNAKINFAVESARRCAVPDTPPAIHALPGDGTATVWWDGLPAPEKVTSYKVTASDGRTVVTNQTTVNVPGLTNGTPYQFKVAAINGAGEGDATSLTPAVTPNAIGARFHSMPPTRVFDTRFGTGGKTGKFGPGESFTLDLASTIPADATSVVLNVTATDQTAQTFVTVWPSGQSRPLASNLNPRPGVAAIPAMVTTRVSPNRKVDLFNNTGAVHLIADVVGYYDTPGASNGALYTGLPPTRLLDTREATSPKPTAFGAAESFDLPIPQLPDGASAVVLNITSTNTTAPGFVTAWPTGQTKPLASNLNPQTGLTRANLTVAKVGTNKSVSLFNNAAKTDLIVDLAGYYTAEGAATGGSEYFAVTPERAYDTRDGSGGIQGPISNATNLAVPFAGHGVVPSAPGAVTVVDSNITVVGPSSGGHTTMWPSGPKPTASNLNYGANEVIANRNFVTLDSGGAFAWSAASNIQYVIDVSGWFGPVIDAAG